MPAAGVIPFEKAVRSLSSHGKPGWAYSSWTWPSWPTKFTCWLVSLPKYPFTALPDAGSTAGDALTAPSTLTNCTSGTGRSAIVWK